MLPRSYFIVVFRQTSQNLGYIHNHPVSAVFLGYQISITAALLPPPFTLEKHQNIISG